MANEHDAQVATTTTVTPDGQSAAPVQNADQMMAQVGNNPEAAADLIRKNPAIRDSLLAAMHARLGNAYVQQVMHALGHPATGSANETAEVDAISADCMQEKTQLLTALAASKTTISNAIARGTSNDLKTAADAAAAALARAETTLTVSRAELDGSADETKKAANFNTADAAYKALNDAVNNQATSVLNAMTIPGAALHITSTGDSLELAVKARATNVAVEIDRIMQLVQTSQAAASQPGPAKLAAADGVRGSLLGMSGTERGYVVGVMKVNGVASDIVDYYQGKSAELRKQGGPQSYGSGSNSGADANAQGGFSHGAAIPKLGADGKPLSVAGHDVPGSIKSVTADPSTGNLGVGVGGKNVAGSVGGDFRADDGTARMEGFKGDLGFSKAGSDGKVGATATKINGGFTQTTSPPSFDGVHWTLAWSVSASAGVSRSTTKVENASAGATGNVDVKGSGSLVKSGTTVYPDQAAAQKAYEDGAFEIQVGELASLNTLPDLGKAGALKEGESVDISAQVDAGGGVSGGASNISVSASVTGGGSTDVKVTKIEGNKIRATIRGALNDSASGSVGTVGVTGGAGHGGSSASSTTFDFDLSNKPGQDAYAQWLKLPHLPPNPGTLGVHRVSSGVGSFSSNNIGIGLGVGPVNGTGTNTSTTGEFTESSEDGHHVRQTIVGSQTDAVKGFNPITPDKTTRTDSLEITNDRDNGKGAPPQYMIKTSIQAQSNADATSQELGKLMGEPNANGKLQGKASGTTGKWAVEGSYTDDQMKKFEQDVVSGKASLTSHGTELGDPAADLKKILADPSKSEHDKQVALSVWFSKRGPEASADLRATLGPPQMNISLDGDKYLTGSTGQGVFEGKRQSIEDRLLDPEMKGDKVKDLLREVQALYTEQLEKRDHIANPENYPELPNGLRHELVKQVEGNYQKIALLRDRVASRAKEEGLGDVSSNPTLNAKMQTVNRARQAAREARGHAVDGRAKHNGALSAGHEVPRAELDRVSSSTVSDQVFGGKKSGNTQVRELYTKSDASWAQAQTEMAKAEDAERKMFQEDALSPASQGAAIAAAIAAAEAYTQANVDYQIVAKELIQITKISKDVVNWDGYDKQFYGTLD
ncbi:MAG: hypothetical protein ABI591_10595 [Kofleriaceae bacterium]